jgi:subtilisin-like proprotein convertase family protein
MRIRSKASLIGLLGLIVCAVPVVADQVPVQFYDLDGNLVVGAAVTATVDGQPGQKFAGSPDGTYVVEMEPGQKVAFRASAGNNTLYNERTLIAPEDLTGPVHVTLDVNSPQDVCGAAGAGVIGINPFTSTGAGTDPAAGTFCGTSITAGGDMVWFDISVPADTSLTASTCNDGNPATGDAAFDTKISVFCLDCAAPTCVGGNDDGPGCSGFSSSFTWCAEANATYHVLLHGFLGASGSGNLALIDNGPCTGAGLCTPPEPEPLRGACCQCNLDDVCTDVECSVETEADCAAAMGIYAGDDTVCTALDGTTGSASAAPGLPIPDNDPDGARSEINVPAGSGFIGDLNVDLNITHTWIGDLEVILTHKDTGSEVTLWARNCGASSNLTILSDDEGTQSFCGPAFAPTTGSIPPALLGLGPGNNLGTFDGESFDGDWSLTANDNFTADTGSITAWSLIAQFATRTCDPLCTDGTTGGGDDDESEDSSGGDPHALAAAAAAGHSDGLLSLTAIVNPTEQQTETRGARISRPTAGKGR